MSHPFNPRARRLTCALAVALVTLAAAPFRPARAQISVLTQRYDEARSGCNLSETALNTSNVNSKQFGKLFSREVEGEIYAQPLIVAGLAMPKGGKRDVVFVATQSNRVYAFDAKDSKADKPLWEVSLGTPVPKADLGSACGTYNDFSGTIGITGTPVIDAASQTIYLVARTKDLAPANGKEGATPAVSLQTVLAGVKTNAKKTADAPTSPDNAVTNDDDVYDPDVARSAGFHQYLHALDITTGRERAGSPVEIKATVPGRGAGSVNGKLSFNPRIHNQRAALALHDGIVTICWAGHCDTGPYHGWIMNYSSKTLRQTAAFCTSPNGLGAGIWMSGGGPTFDERGSMYLATGNGTVDTDRKLPKHTEFGSSVLRLVTAAGRLEVADWFTPYNYTSLNDSDLDTGSTSVVPVPGTDLILSGSKAGVIYALDRRNLGGFDPFNDRQIVQSWPASRGFLYSTPIVNPRASGAPWLYSWGMDDRLKAFAFRPGVSPSLTQAQAVSLNAKVKATLAHFQSAPVSMSDDAIGAPRPGGMLTVSSDNGARGSGIAWALAASSDANQNVSLGVLRAFDADDLGRELWNSGPALGRDGAGYFAKFCPPVVANGRVYLASFSGQLQVYGLNPGAQTPPPRIVSRSGTVRDFVSLESDDVRAQIHYTLDGSLPTAQSPRYQTPFLVDGVRQVKARAYIRMEIPSKIAQTIVTDPDLERPGSGLIGTYFASRDLNGPSVERVDSQVDNNITPVGLPTFNWSARWTGQLVAPTTGTYSLATVSDDGARLWLDGKPIIDDWNVHGATKNRADIELQAGHAYALVLEYFQGESGAACQLLWTPPGADESLIPASALHARYDADIVGTGTGLAGRYFALPDFKGAPIERVDAGINDNPRPDEIPATGWSARWKGEVQAPRSGPFRFATVADDGARLWVDGKQIIDDWNVHGATENSATVQLEKGRKYSIEMEYFQGENSATYQLLWTPPRGEKTPIPATQLYPDALTPVDNGVIGTGQGLTGFYFANTELRGTPLAQDDQKVSIESRPPELGEFNWSARWVGEIQATHSGTFTLTTISDDGVRLWLDGQQLVDDWNVHGDKENSVQVEMVAGRKYPIRLEYFQGDNGAQVQLKWTNPNGVSMVVPRTQLYRATGAGE